MTRRGGRSAHPGWQGRMRFELHLHLQIARANRPNLLRFLSRAVAVYEAPGDIRVRVYERRPDPGERTDRLELLEVIEYGSRETFDADQRRVETNAGMRALLEEWRGLLAAAPRAEVYADISDELHPRMEP